VELEQTIEEYGAAWNEVDADVRASMLANVFSEEGTYVDPMGSADSRAALVEHISGFHAMMPGNTIHATSGVDAHGSVFRFAWEMRNGDEVALEGFDFGELDADGRIARIVGFFGRLPDKP
jgi:hypothetical protein